VCHPRMFTQCSSVCCRDGPVDPARDLALGKEGELVAWSSGMSQAEGFGDGVTEVSWVCKVQRREVGAGEVVARESGAGGGELDLVPGGPPGSRPFAGVTPTHRGDPRGSGTAVSRRRRRGRASRSADPPPRRSRGPCPRSRTGSGSSASPRAVHASCRCCAP
jgi:hypothetical protein